MTVMGIAEWFKRKVLWIFQQIKDYLFEYIEDYLVNRFLKSVNASRGVILAVNTALSLDIMFAVRALLTYYGLGKYATVMFWIAAIL